MFDYFRDQDNSQWLVKTGNNSTKKTVMKILIINKNPAKMNIKWKKTIYLAKAEFPDFKTPLHFQLLGAMPKVWPNVFDAVSSWTKKTSKQKYPYFNQCMLIISKNQFSRETQNRSIWSVYITKMNICSLLNAE